MEDNTKRRISILGSTGSIGTQTLETMEKLGYQTCAITGNKNVTLLEEQARKFCPALVAVADEKCAKDLRIRVLDTNVKVLTGKQGLVEAAEYPCDTLVSALVGTAGLVPTMAAIRQGSRRIALANKETLVCAGTLFTREIREHDCELIPVDSEHSAIFQCLMSGKRAEVKRILLTASGGPFRTFTKEMLESVKKEDALKHPNWYMGAKVTIDSSTMMNKGLEIIEAMHLFSILPENIKVLVHPQSIVHSAVEFCDNSVIAQLGVPDMRLPIQLALTYPERVESLSGELQLARIGTLTFSEPDLEKFPCLRLAMEVAPRRDAAPVVMNAANEIAVEKFLRDEIGFRDICRVSERAVEALGNMRVDSIESVLEADRAARELAASI